MAVRRHALALLLGCIAGLSALSVQAAELRMLADSSARAPLTRFLAVYQKVTGDKVTVAYFTGDEVERRLDAGEAADVAIASLRGLHELSYQGKISSEYPKLIGRVRVALAVAKGAKKPDISTPQKFRDLVELTPLFGYPDPATGDVTGILLTKLIAQFNVTADAKRRSVVRPTANEVMNDVLAGKVPMGFARANEILPVPGLDFVGYLPDSMQQTSVYAVALTKTGAARTEATDLLKRIISLSGSQFFEDAGFEMRR